MSKFAKIFLIACISTTDVIVAHAVSMTSQIQNLLDEKQQKIETLEKCEGKRQGWMIAGISTIGLTTVGVVGNVALANKSKNLSAEINQKNQNLQDLRTQIDDTNEKISQRMIEQAQKQTETVTVNQIEDGSQTTEATVKTAADKKNAPKPTTDKQTKPATPKAATDTPLAEQSKRVVAEQGGSEPDVDANQWSKETYQQCIEHFFPSNTSSLSNARNYWSKSSNGEYCDGYEGGRYLYDYKKSPNSCSNKKVKTLSTGEWMVRLKSGETMRGEAICSSTRGAADELRDSIDMSGDGLNCWCRLTDTDLSDCLVTQKFSWRYAGDYWFVGQDDIEDFENGYSKYNNLMPRGYYALGENSCIWYCANECGYQLFDYGSHRQRAMHGVPLIKEFIIGR